MNKNRLRQFEPRFTNIIKDIFVQTQFVASFFKNESVKTRKRQIENVNNLFGIHLFLNLIDFS